MSRVERALSFIYWVEKREKMSLAEHKGRIRSNNSIFSDSFFFGKSFPRVRYFRMFLNGRKLKGTFRINFYEDLAGFLLTVAPGCGNAVNFN